MRTYADERKSGLFIDGRASLQKLIADVESGKTDFNLILFYDVKGYLTKLLSNQALNCCIQRHQPDILEQFELVVNTVSMEEAVQQ